MNLQENSNEIINSSTIITIEKNPISLEQPKSHLENLSTLEKIFFCFQKRNNLNIEELTIYYNLKKICSEYYDDNNSDHQDKLKSIFKIIFDKSLNDIIDNLWIELGFQDKNPQTDFRGAGIMGLENIKNFIEINKELVIEMCQNKNNFMFAMVSLNITFFLKIFFHLADYLDAKKDKNVICSRDVFKKIFKILNNDFLMNGKKNYHDFKIGFQKFHEILLKYSYKKWILLISKNKNNNLNLSDFHFILEDTKIIFGQTLKNKKINSLYELNNYFEKLI